MGKKLFNSFKIAFSMYSKIPMPNSEWTEENMSYAMCFFPMIGGVIGLILWGSYQLSLYAGKVGISLSGMFWTILYVLIPLLVTGGIHMDGFLDTKDALSSYQPKERRLEILKDPHAGAFAIISCGIYLLSYVGIYSSLTERSVPVIALSFMISRAFSGLSVVTFPQARKFGEGTVATFSKNAIDNVTRAVLILYLAVVGGVMIILGKLLGAAALVTAFCVYRYYHHMAIEKFGGITGDLAGYFLQLCEILMALAVVLGDAILK